MAFEDIKKSERFLIRSPTVEKTGFNRDVQQ